MCLRKTLDAFAIVRYNKFRRTAFEVKRIFVVLTLFEGSYILSIAIARGPVV